MNGSRLANILLSLTAAAVLALPGGRSSAAARAAPVEATLNGLHIVLDDNSGVILRLSHAAAGTILETTPEAAGVVERGAGRANAGGHGNRCRPALQGREDYEDR